MEARYKRMLKGMREKDKAAAKDAAVWSLYILQCSDESFYTGVTNDLDRRFRMHQDGKASRFTRTRRPVALVYSETCGTRSQALIRECAVKALGRPAKEALVAKGGKSSG
jgi:predicted GIY-YIG superfamily endonuclease